MIKLHKNSHEIVVPGARSVKLMCGGFTVTLGSFHIIYNTPLSATVLHKGEMMKSRIVNVNLLIQIALIGIGIISVFTIYGRKNG